MTKIMFSDDSGHPGLVFGPKRMVRICFVPNVFYGRLTTCQSRNPVHIGFVEIFLRAFESAQFLGPVG